MGVPDTCCGASSVPEEPMDFSNSGMTYNCAPISAPALGGSIRGFFGCEGNKLTFGEACIPEGVGFGAGYPMNDTFAATTWENTADSQLCRCNALGLPSTYQGTGCFAAISPYMLGMTDYTIAW